MTTAKSDLTFNFTLLERMPSHGADASHPVLGTHFQLRYDKLQEFCLSKLLPVHVDLIVLAGAVALADRHAPRRQSQGWARTIRLNLPMHEPSVWNTDRVSALLAEALWFATGDHWTFAFHQRHRADDRALQLGLFKWHEERSPVVPFSGGLDSLAMLSHFRNGPQPIVLCTATSSRVKSTAADAYVAADVASRFLDIPFRMKKIEHAEMSYRSRPFVFFSLSALAAVLSGGNRVFVGENGQGALGPSLVRWAGEHPYQGTHPGFTRRLRELLREVWDVVVEFDHPFVWLTKAEMLAKASQDDGLQGVSESMSCSRQDLGRAKRAKNLPRHCGICSGCLLRRMALTDALRGSEEYVWTDLKGAKLSAQGKYRVRTTDNDKRIAEAAVFNHHKLSVFADMPPDSPALALVAFQIAHGTGLDVKECQIRLQRLVKQHKSEWSSFIGKLGDESWVSRLGAMIQ